MKITLLSSKIWRKSSTSPSPYEPVFAVDTRTDEIIWELWVEGFSRAMTLSTASWFSIIDSGDTAAIKLSPGYAPSSLSPVTKACSPKPEQSRLAAEAPDLIPAWVEVISFWRLAKNPVAPLSAQATFKKRRPQRSVSLRLR